MFKKILVAIDRTDYSKAVFQEALALAKATQSQLLLLHVMSPFDESYPMLAYPIADELYSGMHEEAMKTYTRQWEEAEVAAREFLRGLTDEALAAGVTTEFSQNFGDPGRTICSLADTWDAELIILGRRGRSGLSEMLMGSVSNYVLHHAPCSVLAIQGQSVQPEPEADKTAAVAAG